MSEEELTQADITTLKELLKLAQSSEEDELKTAIDALRQPLTERFSEFLCVNVTVTYTETKKYGIDEGAKLSDIQADFNSEVSFIDGSLDNYEYKRKSFEKYCQLMRAVLPDFIKELEQEISDT